MKLHLPSLLRSVLLAGIAVFGAQNTAIGTLALATALVSYTMSSAKAEIVTLTTHQCGGNDWSAYDAVEFVDIAYDGHGGAVYNAESTELQLQENGVVVFSGNTNSSSSDSEEYNSCGGAIYNGGDFGMTGNGNVVFSGNTVTATTSVWSSLTSCGGAICNDGSFGMIGNGNICFSGNTADVTHPDSIESFGGAIFNGMYRYFALRGNGNVTFSENYGGYGGAIYNDGSFEMIGNGDICFSRNTAPGNGIGNTVCNGGTFLLQENASVTFIESSGGCGAIFNNGDFTLRGNGSVTFCNSGDGCILNHLGTISLIGNDSVTFSENIGEMIFNDYGRTITLSGNGSVCFRNNKSGIYNDGNFTLSGNGDICFSGNGAIFYGYNGGTFTLSGNGDICFSGNGAIVHGYNGDTFTLSGNGDVLFEKNAEITNNIYLLRSIYSEGTLNLSATEGKRILFKDAIYAHGMVNLNQDGTGDIIFTGISTEADLREVKGGIDGTVKEILNSRTSEIATNAKLYGGRLILEDGAIIKGQGITVTEGANATIRLNGGTLDETGYTIAVSSGSGLEFAEENVLKAASVQMADGAFLSFVMGEGSGTDWDAQLATGQLHVQVSGDLFNAHQLLTLNDASQYDTSRWTSDNVTVSGASFDSLSWDAGVLTYTPHVITPGEDGSLDDVLPDDGHAVIDGNGHTLNVKNEVQLVQMALKDGIVKLEGENNGIVSVTLTEGGELVLTAGAGLKTGDIISMVASGKGELVISGDITLDNKGMKGKDGKQATVSHADMQVQGDASISHVRVEDSTIDLAEGSTVGFEHVVLAATTRITDDPATANLDDVTAELVMGVNTSLTGSDLLLAGTSLAQSGNTGVTLTLSDDASVLMLEATTFDSLTLSGSTLVLELAGMTLEMFDNAELIAVSFTSGTDYATFDKSLAVTLSVDGINYERGYTMEADDTPTTMYFRGGKKTAATPEPATGTLSLLALAALAARRKRK